MGQAIDYFSQLVTLAHDKSNSLLKTSGIYYLVLLFSIQKRFPAALKLHGAIKELETYQNVSLWYNFRKVQNLIQQYLLEAREALGEADSNAAFAEGRAMTLDQAIVYALKELGL